MQDSGYRKNSIASGMILRREGTFTPLGAADDADRRGWAANLAGHAVYSGHHTAEVAPDDVAALLVAHVTTSI